MDRQLPLDAIGTLEGTDKGFTGNDYLKYYESIFEPFKDKPITILEIGVLGGSSLRTWESFFRCADIVGVDVSADCRKYATARTSIEIGSQDDPEFLARICKKYSPTIIIDDGSHLAHHVIFTFERLFPSLVPGGLYCVEDLHFHSGIQAPSMRGLSKIGPFEFFFEHAQHVAGRYLPKDEDWGINRYVADHAEDVRFCKGCVVVTKKKASEDWPSIVARAAEMVRNDDNPVHWCGLAALFLKLPGGVERAEEAARRAVALDDNDEYCHRRLGEILLTQGKTEEAAKCFGRVVELAHNEWFLVELGRACVANGDHEKAEAAFREAVALNKANPAFQDALEDFLAQK